MKQWIFRDGQQEAQKSDPQEIRNNKGHLLTASVQVGSFQSKVLGEELKQGLGSLLR